MEKFSKGEEPFIYLSIYLFIYPIILETVGAPHDLATNTTTIYHTIDGPYFPVFEIV